jgi:hypothetical protein
MITDVQSEIVPDPRSESATWDLCAICEQSGGLSWGAAVVGNCCFIHLLPEAQENCVRGALSGVGDLDCRGCRIDHAERFVVKRAGGDEIGPINCGGATFTGEARFDGVRFTGEARFDGAIFNGEASFSDATFAGDASFYRARFLGEATFFRAMFSRDAWFNSATFAQDVIFNRATFVRDADFDKAMFSAEARFFGTSFEWLARFREARFTRRMPGFFAATLAAIDLDPDRVLVGLHHGSRSERHAFFADRSSHDVRNLRKALEDSRNESGANTLYEIEMACRAREVASARMSAGRVSRQAIIGFYGTTSGYATRPQRAFVWFVALVAVATASLALYSGIRTGPRGPPRRSCPSPPARLQREATRRPLRLDGQRISLRQRH